MSIVPSARLQVGAGPIEINGISPRILLWHPISGGGDVSTVQRALLAASRRGILTNAIGFDAEWGKKDDLELLLRAFERATRRHVRRPETYAAARPQVGDVLDHFAASKIECLIKPANRARGESIVIVRPGDPLPALAAGNYVVQELVRDPLLMDRHKIDFRCYVLVDSRDPGASRLCRPVFVRRAGVAYERGAADAEITNCAYRCRRNLEGGMWPLDGSALLDSLQALVDDLLAAVRWWYATPHRAVGRRVQLWGVDAIARSREREAQLLEINLFPDLFMDVEPCDTAIERIIVEHYWPALARESGGPT